MADNTLSADLDRHKPPISSQRVMLGTNAMEISAMTIMPILNLILYPLFVVRAFDHGAMGRRIDPS